MRAATEASKSVMHKAVSSAKWSVLLELVSSTAAPIVLVILARILTPEIFGVVAVASIAISFSQMFWDAGLSKALIQTETDQDDAANVVFWTNVFLGILIYLCLFFFAPIIAAFLNSPTSGPVLRVLGLQVVVGSLSSVQQALFVRGLSFHRLFWIKLLTSFIPGVFSIPMALYGYGVWALVAGSLAGQILNLFLLWFFSPWRPRLQYDLFLAGNILRFGFWVLAESFADWLLVWGDGMIISRYLGVHDLGVYKIGVTIILTIFGLTVNPFLPILFPSFSRLQHDLPALTRSFHKVVGFVMALALPMGIGLLLLGEDMAAVLFGNKWGELGFVLSILGMMKGLFGAVMINGDTFRAIGRPEISTKITFVQVLYFLPAYFIAAQSGLTVFVYVRLALVLTSIPIQIFLCKRILGVSFFYLWEDGKSAILAAITMGLCLQFLKWSVNYFVIGIPHILLLALYILAGITVYTATLWLLDRPFIMEISRLTRHVVST
jgi:PST family polysaccharide transporter